MRSRLKYFLVGLALFCFSATNSLDLKEFRLNGYAQGTTYAISYFAKDSLVTKPQIDSILNVIDLSMSLYKDNSIISKFNQSDNGIAIDEHFSKVFKRAVDIYTDTQGLFDVTVAPLVQLWGFGPKKIISFPDSNAIKAIMPCIGMDKLALKADVLVKDKKCISIDLNGIAQGYSVDVVANFLIEKGIKVFVVEIGGELRALGPKPNGLPIKIGIEGPIKNQYDEAKIKHIMSFTEGAVTTSGNYAKYLSNGNQKISHLIDPKSGHPLQNEMISVTVFAKDAITADGYDNALMAMNLQQALAFVNARKELEAYIIYKKPNGKVADTLTTGFKKLILN